MRLLLKPNVRERGLTSSDEWAMNMHLIDVGSGAARKGVLIFRELFWIGTLPWRDKASSRVLGSHTKLTNV